ncbi:probable gluconokinase isoform X2 [Pezoporus wallicus]|uniref:probable gluconokinase isoform X2 n=1 Tax=Pezoporus wallicus TaxID=35540 RepID=UPI00254E5913|nr:probable gluconokinase isoform X2 [Pezoporus wallicus]XP_061312239.1 probable gluconokinase isoform X1 [Pezoporus flaviventris]
MVLVVVMGVSGAGKTTVGSRLAAKLGWKFYDADDYHSTENKKKMAEGIALNDEDRIPWLCALHDILRREQLSRQDAVLACSALKKMYRHILVSGVSAIESNHPEQPRENPALRILFVHLDGPVDTIAGRLEKRRGHFMPPELLKSQFDTLEPLHPPENFITVSLEKSLPEVVLEIEHAIFSG